MRLLRAFRVTAVRQVACQLPTACCLNRHNSVKEGGEARGAKHEVRGCGRVGRGGSARSLRLGFRTGLREPAYGGRALPPQAGLGQDERGGAKGTRATLRRFENLPPQADLRQGERGERRSRQPRLLLL